MKVVVLAQQLFSDLGGSSFKNVLHPLKAGAALAGESHELRYPKAAVRGRSVEWDRLSVDIIKVVVIQEIAEIRDRLAEAPDRMTDDLLHPLCRFRRVSHLLAGIEIVLIASQHQIADRDDIPDLYTALLTRVQIFQAVRDDVVRPDLRRDGGRHLPQRFRAFPVVEIKGRAVHDTGAVPAIRKALQDIVAHKSGPESAGTAAQYDQFVRSGAELFYEIDAKV